MIFYNLLYNFLRFLALVLAPVLDKKSKAWIVLRNNKDFFQSAIQTQGKRLWIHASSGEIEYAKSFIREYKKEFPQNQVFVSYSSLSAPSLFKNISSEVTQFFPLNWDITSDNSKLLNFIKPDILIFSRTDYWPNLIQQAQKQNIRLATIAANPKKSVFNSFWLKFCCRGFKYFSCVEEAQVSYLKAILPNTRVEYIPDTRFDQVFHRLQQNPQVNLNLNKKTITLGSTWPKDEEVIKPIAEKLINQGFALIWAPHDIKHANNLHEELKKLLPTKTILKLAEYKNSQPFDILVVDRVGVLADFYRFSNLSFVGGSFVSRVHSVMEPLCAGNFVIVGPHYSNNPEAIAFKKLSLVRSVANKEQFLEAVNYFETNQDQLKELKLRTESKKGGSLKTVKAISEILMF